MKKKFLTYAMTGALSLGVIGGTALPTFAATNQQETVDDENLDNETQQKVEEILSNLQQELADLGVSFNKFNGQGGKFANLDDETKAQAQEIMQQVKDGSLTQEEANTQLEALGVSLPDHKDRGRGDMFANLDDETKTQAQVIMQQVKDGSLTQEEANTQLEALGVSLPDRKGLQFDNLDDETKEEVETLIEEAKEQLDELGVDLPSKQFNQIID